jgi:superfamily II DNA or RNA helicase
MPLYPHQAQLVDTLPYTHLLCWSCGTGKTLASIKLTRQHERVLVICPKPIKENWRREIDKWNDVGGSKYYIYTKEEFRKHHKTDSMLKNMNAVIVDEAHFFGNYKSQLHKALWWYVNYHNIPYRYFLTATPYLSTPWNIWALAKLLGHDDRTWQYKAFQKKYFYPMNIAGRTIYQPKVNISKEIATLVNKLGTTVKMEDCVDLPDVIEREEYFDLTDSQKQGIRNIDEYTPIVRFTKIHQISGGSLKGNEYNKDMYFISEKLRRVSEYAQTHKKLVVVCRYNNEIEMIRKKLTREYNVRVITGQVKNRDEMVQKANEDTHCVLLVNAACSEGYELPTFDTMIFYSHDFSLKNYEQIKGRIQRINNIHPVQYIHFITRPCRLRSEIGEYTVDIDKAVYEALQRKKDFQIEIYAKAINKTTHG